MGRPTPPDAFRTPSGIYIPADVAEKLKPPHHQLYRRPDDWGGTIGSYISTPIYILPPPPPAEPASRWTRARRRITRWRRDA